LSPAARATPIHDGQRQADAGGIGDPQQDGHLIGRPEFRLGVVAPPHRNPPPYHRRDEQPTPPGEYGEHDDHRPAQHPTLGGRLPRLGQRREDDGQQGQRDSDGH
jgi:hypothetical protein